METPPSRTGVGEPIFDAVDNIVNWPSFVFRPEYEGRALTSKYKCHTLPTGVTPVPIDMDTNTRIIKNWGFHYNGWNAPNMTMKDTVHSENKPYCRNYVPDHHHIGTGIAVQELFPEKRKGCLDVST